VPYRRLCITESEIIGFIGFGWWHSALVYVKNNSNEHVRINEANYLLLLADRQKRNQFWFMFC